MNHQEFEEKLIRLDERLERIESYLGIREIKPTPGFDPIRFQRILQGYFGRVGALFLVAMVVGVLVLFPFQGTVSDATLFGIPWFNAQFPPTDAPSVFGIIPIGIVAVMGIGVVSFGGLAVGIVAFGGGALGVVAIGGGAVGVIAFGGGAVGLIAFGGGACGYIAVGGGACGRYVLAGDGRGRYVFDRRRQDEEAVRFFCAFLPRLREAFAETSQAAAR